MTLKPPIAWLRIATKTIAETAHALQRGMCSPRITVITVIAVAAPSAMPSSIAASVVHGQPLAMIASNSAALPCRTTLCIRGASPST